MVDLSTDAGTLSGRQYGADERYARIVKVGFKAVPPLIAHLGDDRLTRAETPGINNFAARHLRVKDLVGDLIEGLAGEEMARGDGDEDVGGGWIRRQQGYPLKRAAAEAWWTKARAVGEKAYLLARVLPERGKAGHRMHPTGHLVEIIAAKYPTELPALYRTVLKDRPEVVSWELAEGIRDSGLPAAEKVAVLTSGAEHDDCHHRLPALQVLATLDTRAFASRLLASIERLPADVDEAYWLCPEAHMARLALETDDARVWTALVAAIKRSKTGLRMELLNHLGDPDAKRHRAERLGLFASYLNDETLRDKRATLEFDGPGAGFPYETIEVRNFAAIEITRLLGGETETDYKRTSEGWAKIRGRARADAERELVKIKKERQTPAGDSRRPGQK